MMYQLVFFLLFAMAMAFGSSPSANAVRLSEVKVLTLRAGEHTAHRRVDPVPQLRCTSHPGVCELHQIDILRCTNEGSSYSREDVQWTCTANLPSTLQLNSTDVICEGYSSPSDSYILKGSCGVEYQLALTSEGKKKHPSLARHVERLARNRARHQPAFTTTGTSPGAEAPETSLFSISAFVLIILVWVVALVVLSRELVVSLIPTSHGRPAPPSGQEAPSPSLIPPIPPIPSMPPMPPMPTPRMQPSSAGLVSAFAAGAAAGYMTRGTTRQNRQDRRTRECEQTRASSDARANTSTNSSHMSTGFGSTRRRRTPGTLTSESSSSSSSDSETLPSTPSSTSRESRASVGVGSTRRR